LHHLRYSRQGARPRCRPRLCLLKGCEQSFTPSCPQSRFCSPACRAAARRWSQVKASRQYRATARGKKQRRTQHRRYRQRRRERQASASADVPAAGEGQRPARPCEDCHARMCARPGCYETFVVADEAARQRFCSVACRLALRRVLDREARYQQRRRRWRREQRTSRCQRRDTS